MSKSFLIVLAFGLCAGLFACANDEFYPDDEEGDGGYFEDVGEPNENDLSDEEPRPVEDEEELAVLIAPASDLSSSPNTTSSDRLVEAYTVFIEDAMQAKKIPGVAVAVIHGNDVIMARGFGWRNVDEQLPVTAETLFHIGSTNKSMTAMAIASLVDEGVFDWDTPVADIYPGFKLAEATDTVTLRHLLSMRGGIPDSAEDDFDVDNGTAEDLFTYVANIELLDAPGEEFSYSNISASLSGFVGGNVYDEQAESLYDSYITLLQERVLDPIGMKNAVVRYSEAQQNPNYGKSYLLDRGEIVEAEPEDFDGDPFAPSGTLKADVTEMALYISTQLNRGAAPNGTQVVSEKNMAEMWQPYLENYAMGWEVSTVQGAKVISHEGSFDNYLSVIGFVPELDLGFVILMNSADTGEELVIEGPKFLISQVLSE
ncbi:MAG: CubicO group peptidase (beta-lactamase class C family) [Cellvibrionaceae bacterium]|jgi:CubicO group peptidase (beta-lactamase class C family)